MKSKDKDYIPDNSYHLVYVLIKWWRFVLCLCLHFLSIFILCCEYQRCQIKWAITILCWKRSDNFHVLLVSKKKQRCKC
jgi:hypothetical protein